MTSDLSGKRLLQNPAFQMETLGRHVVSSACLQTPIARAGHGRSIKERKNRIRPLTDESGDQESVRIDMAWDVYVVVNSNARASKMYIWPVSNANAILLPSGLYIQMRTLDQVSRKQYTLTRQTYIGTAERKLGAAS